MFPSFIPEEAKNLTEATSIELISAIERHFISTHLSPEPIATAYVNQLVQGGDSSPPILLLHGFDSSLLEFRRLFPLLAKEKETWAVDLLGFGFTDRQPTVAYGPLPIKNHLYYFWKSLIQKPVILLGASMGGAVAIDFALTYPDAVAKLVLVDSAGLANPPLMGKLMFPPLDYLATEFLRNPKIRLNISRAAYYDKSRANADAQLCAGLHVLLPGWNKALIAFTKSGGYGGLAKQLPQIKQPTLIIWGENDGILGTKDAYKFEQGISNSQLVWIPQAGHVPHLEKPLLIAQSILNY